jgi:hydroxyethylthiazole kinase-like uncharacterized protein yjeF
MTPIAGQPILTAAQMRAAEDAAIAAGASVATLMERAGTGVAGAVHRLAAGAPVLIACGRGNNGGDGYVAARILKARGIAVRVAATGTPQGDTAIAACAGWDGPVEALETARPAPVFVDAIFGTGLSRHVDAAIGVPLAALARAAHLSIAVDLPSGFATDTGEVLIDDPVGYAVTLALGAPKPVHVLEPSSKLCGAVRVLDLGIEVPQDGQATVIGRPRLAAPTSSSTKYTRGMVAIIGGAMPGAAALAAEAAMRSGAGYVLLLADEMPWGSPHALVRKNWSTAGLDEPRIGCVLVGPGLGRDRDAREKLAAALASDHPLVIDGDALHLLEGRTFHDRAAPILLTPHGGEFKAVFGDWHGSKIDAARAAARKSGAVVVFKGPDTVIADPSGAVVVAPRGSSWLSTAGTGDVLAGAVAAMASDPQDGARLIDRMRVPAAVWLHGEAARRLGGAFVADDLARTLSVVRAS